MQLQELLAEIPYEATADISALKITNIAHIFADITPGSLFICLRGIHNDSHALLPTLKSAGAVAAIVEAGAYTSLPEDLPCIIVPDTRYALARLWSNFCGTPQASLRMIGITGTNGKTSTAYLLYRIFRSCGRRVALLSTVVAYLDGEVYHPQRDTGDRMTTMTTPDPDLLYPFLAAAKARGIDTVIMEVSSHALALQKVVPIHFEEALFTNLASEHLDYHETMEAYGAEKEKLFSMASHAIINVDDAFGATLAGRVPCPVLTCAIESAADARAATVDIPADENSPQNVFLYTMGDIRYLVKLRLPGIFAIKNALLALTAAVQLGISPCAAFRAVEAVSGIPGRFEQISGADDDIRVLIDYAHTETALRALLTAAHDLTPPPNHVILVFGCGGNRDREKRAPMGRAAMELADYTFITSDNARNEEPTAIIKEILQGHTDPERRRVIVERKRAISTAIALAAPGDVVLLAGKGHEKYEVVKGQIRPFDESTIAIEALAKRRLCGSRPQEDDHHED